MLYGLLVALGIGALIGIERERTRVKESRIAGSMTHIITAFFGKYVGNNVCQWPWEGGAGGGLGFFRLGMNG